MSSIDDYRNNLRTIMRTYRPWTVLELGVEGGKSTQVFWEFPCKLVSIDIQDNPTLREASTKKDWEFLIMDAREFLNNDKRAWDMVFMDLTYYEQEGVKYGSKEAYNHCIDCWMEDIEKAYNRVNDDGVLVINDYINQSGKRPYPRLALNALATKLKAVFEVYPSRGGIGVLQK